MSMCLGLVTLSDENIARMLADPPLVWLVIAPDDPAPYEEARKSAQRKPSLLGRILGARPFAGGEPATLVLAEDELMATDLDKAWHGIHYLLTRTAWEGSPPLNLLVAGGTPVGAIDVGYGPARALRSSEIVEAHHALGRISDDELKGRFAPEAMLKAEIYPEIWDRDPAEDDTLDYLMEYVGTLRAFLRDAVEEGRGAVVYLF
jgi:hypothetical protein